MRGWGVTSRTPHLLGLLGLLGLPLLTLGGCKKTVDTKGFEKTIDERVRGLGLVPGAISCPSGIEAKQGTQFTCKVPIDKASYDLVVTIKSVEGSSVQLDTAWAKGPAVVAQKLAENGPAAIKKALDATASLDCGTEPLIFLAAGKVKCKLTSGTTHATLAFTFDDKLEVTGWELDPHLLSRKKLEGLLTPDVEAKTSPTTKVDCGPDDLLARPADGTLTCSISDGAHTAKIHVTVSEDLKVEKWETVSPG